MSRTGQLRHLKRVQCARRLRTDSYSFRASLLGSSHRNSQRERRCWAYVGVGEMTTREIRCP
jgi:hypothetical protein